ncbi:tropomyosin-like [Pundamilia nyererei]|uniref:Tropomyosin-like n=1 Tax=Pundamilia nyererei TaxID=303518 RepID=A0A9Y3S3P0_9CICH|nr:PREDICTED: tropomyosin-like [Pundamilia nyererei]
MSLKNWFGFPISPENLTPAVLNCIIIIVVSVPILLVVTVTYKCKQKKNRGSKNENKTAERNSSEALNSGETENDNKHLKEKEAAALKLSDEHQTEEGDEKNLQTLENNSPNHVVDEEVAVGQQQLQGEEQHRGHDELDKTEVMTPDTLKEKQEVSSQLNLSLAVTTRNKVNEEVATAQQQLQREEQREVDANVKKKLERKKKFNDIVARFEQGAQQQSRKDAEEDLLDRKSPLSCDPEDSLKVIEEMDAELKMKDNDVQMLKKELETNKKQIHQPSADHEDTSQTIDELKQTQNLLEKKNAEIREIRKKFENELNKEKRRHKEDLNSLKEELEVQIKKLKDKVSEVQQQLKDEQQSREEAEKNAQTLMNELENKNKELQESQCQFESLKEQTRSLTNCELKERHKEKKTKEEAEEAIRM